MEKFNYICLLLALAAMYTVIVKSFTMDLPTYKAIRWQVGITLLALAMIIAVFYVLKWAICTSI